MAPIIKTLKIAALLSPFILVSLIILNMGGVDFFENRLSHSHGLAFAADDNGEKKTEEQSKDQAADPAPCPPCPTCPDPAKVVLEGLEEKRAAISRDEERLGQERKRLEKFKEELDEKLQNLGNLKQQINDDIARLEQKKTDLEIKAQAAFEAKMDSLVKMYSGMKPKKAAAIVDKMDLEVAKQIFSRMRETSAAQILAYVDSEKAANISERIAFRKK